MNHLRIEWLIIACKEQDGYELSVAELTRMEELDVLLRRSSPSSTTQAVFVDHDQEASESKLRIEYPELTNLALNESKLCRTEVERMNRLDTLLRPSSTQQPPLDLDSERVHSDQSTESRSSSQSMAAGESVCALKSSPVTRSTLDSTERQEFVCSESVPMSVQSDRYNLANYLAGSLTVDQLNAPPGTFLNPNNPSPTERHLIVCNETVRVERLSTYGGSRSFLAGQLTDSQPLFPSGEFLIPNLFDETNSPRVLQPSEKRPARQPPGEPFELNRSFSYESVADQLPAQHTDHIQSIAKRKIVKTAEFTADLRIVSKTTTGSPEAQRHFKREFDLMKSREGSEEKARLRRLSQIAAVYSVVIPRPKLDDQQLVSLEEPLIRPDRAPPDKPRLQFDSMILLKQKRDVYLDERIPSSTSSSIIICPV